MDQENRKSDGPGCSDSTRRRIILSPDEKAALAAVDDPEKPEGLVSGKALLEFNRGAPPTVDQLWDALFELELAKAKYKPFPAALEDRPMVESSGWRKYFSTEFLTFSLIFAVSTVALFLGTTSFQWWFTAALSSGVVCGLVRTVKHLKILGLEFEGYRAERESGESPE